MLRNKIQDCSQMVQAKHIKIPFFEMNKER